jgi:hypothetical protein
MKRIGIVLMFLFFTVAIAGYVQSEDKKPVAMKPGKALVKRLPAEIEGVELVKNKVRLKSGYNFVKTKKGGYIVARMAGGGGHGSGAGVGGTWNCSCGGIGKGTCTTVFTSGNLSCSKLSTDTCDSSCELTVTTKTGQLGVVMY